jgi:hypothetical protein
VKLFHEVVERARLLDWIQILALDVFHERKLKGLLVTHLTQHNWNAKKLRSLRRAPSPLPCNQLVPRP